MSDSAGTGLVTVRQPFAKPSCLSSRINNSLRLSTWLETSPHLWPSKVCKLLLSSPVFQNGRKDFRGLPRLTRTRIRARSVSVSVQLRGRVTRAAYTQFSFLNKSHSYPYTYLSQASPTQTWSLSDSHQDRVVRIVVRDTMNLVCIVVQK